VRILWQSYTDPEAHAAYCTRLTDYLAEIAGPGVEFELRGLRPTDRYLHRLTETRCGAQVAAALIEAEAEGFDAVVLGHFQDPSLWDMRAAVDIPVLGLGESTMLHACTLGNKIGLVTISPSFVSWHEEQIVRYRLENRVVAVTAMATDVDLFMRAFEEQEPYDDIKQQLVDKSRELAQRGVEVIVPAGGLPALLFRNERDLQADGALIVNPIALVAKLAETTATLRQLTGAVASRHSTFARPSPEALREYVDQIGIHTVTWP